MGIFTFMIPSEQPEPARALPPAPRTEVAKWEAYFEKLVAFRRRHGHLIVSARLPENAQLRSWITCQRRRQRAGSLLPERRQRVEAIGFPWDGRDYKRKQTQLIWNKKFASLMEFHRQHGHFNVPSGDPKFRTLAGWVVCQRSAKRHEQLLPEREQWLEEGGFPWQASRERSRILWERSFDNLLAFHKKHGDYRLRSGESKVRGNQALYSWAAAQRRLKRLGRLRPEYQQRLEAVGFPWASPAPC